jgi:predicted ester cyclase
MPGITAPLDFATFFHFGQMWHNAFPDEQTSFEDQVAEGGKVVSRMSSTATHLGEFQGMPATGKKIRVSGIWIDRIAEGKIVERWGVVDMMSVMQQLGVIPAPAQG